MKIERNGACEIQGDCKLTNSTESVMQHILIEKITPKFVRMLNKTGCEVFREKRLFSKVTTRRVFGTV